MYLIFACLRWSLQVTKNLIKLPVSWIVRELFLCICQLVWQTKVTPEEWEKWIILLLPKKGDLAYCYNNRGITLLDISGKAFFTILPSLGWFWLKSLEVLWDADTSGKNALKNYKQQPLACGKRKRLGNPKSTISEVATEESRGNRVPLDSEKFARNGEKEGENQENGKEGKIGKKRKNREGSFTLPLLTDRAGYVATVHHTG